MKTESNASNETPRGEKHPLPVCETVPAIPPIEIVKPDVPAIGENNIPAQLCESKSGTKASKERQPLRVSVIKDMDLSPFERKTVTFGKVGIVIAILTLTAGAATTSYVEKQFTEMSNQTELLKSSIKQVHDDVSLQLKTTQRPWVGIDGDIAVLSTDEAPLAGKNVTQFIDIDSIRYRLKNFGNTPALEVVTKMDPLMERWDYSHEQTAQLDGIYDELCQKADSLAYDLTRNPQFPIGDSLFPGVIANQKEATKRIVIGANRQTPVEILGCIKYKDGFGGLHHTRFCMEGKDWTTPLRACGIGQSAD